MIGDIPKTFVSLSPEKYETRKGFMLFMCKPYEWGHSCQLNQRQSLNVDILGRDEQFSKK